MHSFFCWDRDFNKATQYIFNKSIIKTNEYYFKLNLQYIIHFQIITKNKEKKSKFYKYLYTYYNYNYRNFIFLILKTEQFNPQFYIIN